MFTTNNVIVANSGLSINKNTMFSSVEVMYNYVANYSQLFHSLYPVLAQIMSWQRIIIYIIICRNTVVPFFNSMVYINY